VIYLTVSKLQGSGIVGLLAKNLNLITLVFQVWGKDFDGLNYSEPWVLLGVSAVVLTCSIKFVLLAPDDDQGIDMASTKKTN